MNLERKVLFESGFDCRKFECINDSPKCIPGEGGSHGLSGLKIRWLVRGPEGAVQFLLMTGLTPVPLDDSSHSGLNETMMMPADLGYHAYKPQYPDQDSMGKCEYLDGAECYYDGSGLNAEGAFKTLINAGGEALWEFLGQYYMAVFHDKEYPKPVEFKKPLRK